MLTIPRRIVINLLLVADVSTTRVVDTVIISPFSLTYLTGTTSQCWSGKGELGYYHVLPGSSERLVVLRVVTESLREVILFCG